MAEDGTVFIRTTDGERPVGQYPEGSPSEALAFFTRRFDALAFEVELLEQRVHASALSPDEAKASIAKVRDEVKDAHAVGDLASLSARLDSLGPVLAQQRVARRAERARKVEDSRQRKERIVVEAEKLGQGRDWRNGANRLRDLLEEWKALPRLDRATDDALWHRFSSARTIYTRARKAHFSELDEKRGTARAVKERLIKEAEELSTSTDWGPTAGKYRNLMTRWKEAGPAAKSEDDALWTRFRGAQDEFFGARDAAMLAQDAEFAANAEKKDALLVEAEALIPVTDLDSAKRAFRDISERWDAAGKVPRNRIKDLEARIHKVETAIRGVEDATWSKTDPEKSARADDMISKLERTIAGIEADLATATARGDAKRVSELQDNLASRQSFLEMARQTAADFG
ncbi:MAG: DUF349 domain-containing protein [Actinomycetota bacterium]|nr:DUF349 domain-containing protein [Actinomycetota bacterium]